jgi:predicted DNA-binding transcriptional regulator AlpA
MQQVTVTTGKTIADILKTMPELMRLNPHVLRVVPISRASVWRLAAAGKFPKPIRLTERCTAWKKSDIEAWLQERGAV